MMVKNIDLIIKNKGYISVIISLTQGGIMKKSILSLLILLSLFFINCENNNKTQKTIIGRWDIVGDDIFVDFKENNIWETSDEDEGTWEMINDTLMYFTDGDYDTITVVKIYTKDFMEIKLPGEIVAFKRISQNTKQ